MASSTPSALQQLHRLNASSPDFSHQLQSILSSRQFENCALNLGEDDVTRLVDFLNKALNKLDPAGVPFQTCKTRLRDLCGSKGVLPQAQILSLDALRVSLEPFATGGYGDIYQATFGGSIVRVKRIRVSHPRYSDEAQKAFCGRAVTWSRLNHPNVLPILGFTISPLQIISVWMPNGNLPDYLRKNRGVDVVGLLADVAKGLSYLHVCDVIHGELKGSNILVDASRHARISDFGISMVTNRDNFAMGPYQPEYSPRWSAPEVLTEKKHSKSSDIFSFGMLMSEVFSGTPPMIDLPGFNAALAIIQGKRPPRPTHAAVTERLWDLMQRCWERDPRMRPEAAEVLRILLTPSASRPHG